MNLSVILRDFKVTCRLQIIQYDRFKTSKIEMKHWLNVPDVNWQKKYLPFGHGLAPTLTCLFHIMFVSYTGIVMQIRSQEDIVNIRQIFFSVLQGMFTK